MSIINERIRMSDIQTSKNVFFHWNTTTTPGTYTQQVFLPFIPDICIVRQINYTDSVPTTGKGLYFIWSDMKNDYIGSFTVSENSYNTNVSVQLGESSFISNPQTTLTQINATPHMSFRIDALVNGAYVPQTTLAGSLNLQVDFIRYKEY